MTIEQLIPIGLTLLLGSLVQGAVGFAYALFVIPVLVWLGASLSQAVALIVVSVLVQVLIGTVQLRKYVRWPDVLWGTLIRYITIPVGTGLLVMIDAFETDQIKQILGGILLLTLVLQLAWKVQPRDVLHPGWRLLAFSASGIMHGMASIGGPPAVLWVLAHRWNSQETRAFLFSLFLLGIPIQVILLFFNFGSNMIQPMLSGLLFSPFVILGSVLGIRLGNLIPQTTLRWISFVILSFIALASLAAPLF